MVFLSAASGYALAGDVARPVEVLGSTAINYSVTAAASQSADVAVGVGFNRLLADGLQVGLIGNLGLYSRAGSKSFSGKLFAGPTFNFPAKNNVDNTVFLFVGAGVSSANLLLDTSRAEGSVWAIATSFGARFQVHEVMGINYRPVATVLFPQYSRPQILFELLAFSISF